MRVETSQPFPTEPAWNGGSSEVFSARSRTSLDLRPSRSPLGTLIVVALIGFAADQASKARAFAPASESAGPQRIGPGLATAVLARNDGAVANLAGGHTITATVCALNGLIMLGALSWSCACRKHWRRHDAVFLGLLSAGMLGNSTDRLVLGYVRDFLVAALCPSLIFNLADVFIVIGFLLLLGSWVVSRRGVSRGAMSRGWSSP